MHPASTSSPTNHELEVLKAKRGESASPVDVERPDEVEALKAKLAANVAPTENETRSVDVLRMKSVHRRALSTRSPADDELEILKAKLGKSAAMDVERPDEAEALETKLAGNLTASDDETTPSTVPRTEEGERGPATETLPGAAFGVASGITGPALVGQGASGATALRRRSGFDLAFALVIALWALAVALALTTGAEWWVFGFCVVVTVAVALFGVLDSAGFRQRRRQN